MNKQKFKKALALAFVYLVLALMYLPIIVLIIYSFTEARNIGQWSGFSVGLYIKLFYNDEIMEALLNTLIVALTSSALATAIGTISAVGIFYLRKIPKAVANSVNQITVINADIVTAVAFMLFFMAVKIFPEGFLTLIISHTMITIPYVVLAVLPRLGQLNPNTYEAGLDVGAGPMRTLFTVVIPQLIPSMVSGFALAFTLSLDDYVITKFNGGEVVTISTYLYSKVAKKGIIPVLKALSSLIFLVSLSILVLINVYNRRKAKKIKNLI